jgi:hypothetical protein
MTHLLSGTGPTRTVTFRTRVVEPKIFLLDYMLGETTGILDIEGPKGTSLPILFQA